MAASIRLSASRIVKVRFPASSEIFIAPQRYYRNNPAICCQYHRQCTNKRFRYYSTKEPEDKVKIPSRPRRYALDKVVTILSNSADKLEKRLPKVFQIYRTARTGIRCFIADAKEYYRITRQLWSGQSLADFSRKDLELYRQCSHDLPVMSIALLISLAPGGVLIFPLAYMFPRLLLSHHFWTPQQKEEFLRLKMVKQLGHYDTLMSLLERKTPRVPSQEGRLGLQKILRELQSDKPVPANEILKLHHAFEGRPFGTDFLSIRHRYHLGRSLSLPFRRKQMVRSALLLHFVDMAMLREGLDDMTEEELDRACMWRGLNPQCLVTEQKKDYLRSWTSVSSVIHEPSISLLLHLPVFLSYSHPSNKKLLREASDKTRH